MPLSLPPLPWSVVAIVGILAVLVLTGHDGTINLVLVGVVAMYLGWHTVFRGGKE